MDTAQLSSLDRERYINLATFRRSGVAARRLRTRRIQPETARWALDLEDSYSSGCS